MYSLKLNWPSLLDTRSDRLTSRVWPLPSWSKRVARRTGTEPSPSMVKWTFSAEPEKPEPSQKKWPSWRVSELGGKAGVGV